MTNNTQEQEERNTLTLSMDPNDLPDEKWAPVPACEDHYLISTYGRIKKDGQLQQLRTNSYGNVIGTIRKNGPNQKTLSRSVSQIVYRVFGEMYTGPRRRVYYIDGNPSNCHISNLRPGIKMGKKGSIVLPESPVIEEGVMVRIVRPEDNNEIDTRITYDQLQYVGKISRVRLIGPDGSVFLEGIGDGVLGYGWPPEWIKPVEVEVGLSDRGRIMNPHPGDWVWSVTSNYVDCPYGWSGYVDTVHTDGTMDVVSYGDTHRVLINDFLGRWVPENPHPGDHVTIVDRGKLHPKDLDWILSHDLPLDVIARFAYGDSLPPTIWSEVNSVKAAVRCEVLLYDEDDDVLLVEEIDGGRVFLVDRPGVTMSTKQNKQGGSQHADEDEQ